jgi:Protein of unknown function (DUF2958)
MMLLTKALREQFLDNGRRQAAVKGTSGEIDFHPVVELFNPCGGRNLVAHRDRSGRRNRRLGLCDLGMGFPEFGTVSLTELAEYRGRLGFPPAAALC